MAHDIASGIIEIAVALALAILIIKVVASL